MKSASLPHCGIFYPRAFTTKLVLQDRCSPHLRMSLLCKYESLSIHGQYTVVIPSLFLLSANMFLFWECAVKCLVSSNCGDP